MPETFIKLPEVTRRGLIKGTAAIAGTAAVTNAFLFDTLDDVTAADTAAPAGVEDFVATTCWIGKQDCGMIARRIDGRVVKFEGNPTNPRNVGTLCRRVRPRSKLSTTRIVSNGLSFEQMGRACPASGDEPHGTRHST